MSVATATQKAGTVLAENYVLEPPVNVYELVRNYGIDIEEQPFPSDFDNVSGFINIEDGRPTMYVNLNEPKNRRKFTVAHEFGHWLLHKEKIRKDPGMTVLYRKALGAANDDPAEREANAFAAELLVPMEMLQKEIDKPVHELAEKFQVSTDVIGYRKVSAEHARATEKPRNAARK